MTDANLNFYIGVPVEDWPKSIGLKTYSANADGLVGSGILKSGKHFYKKWDRGSDGQFYNPRFVIEGSRGYQSNPPSGGHDWSKSLAQIIKEAKGRHEKARKAAKQRGRHSFPMLPYEASWAFEQEYDRHNRKNPSKRQKSARRSRRNAGSFSRRIRPAKSVARRLKIYGGARLKKYGSKIVKRNSGCGCKRRR